MGLTQVLLLLLTLLLLLLVLLTCLEQLELRQRLGCAVAGRRRRLALLLVRAETLEEMGRDVGEGSLLSLHPVWMLLLLLVVRLLTGLLLLGEAERVLLLLLLVLLLEVLVERQAARRSVGSHEGGRGQRKGRA